MKILVIGQSVIDNINTPTLRIIQAGGIFYTILGFNTIVQPSDEIYLVTSVEKNSYKYFKEEYDKVNKKYLIWSDLIPTVTLNIYKDKERDEQYSIINSSLFVKYDELKNFDAILLNMITGFDITLNQLKNIRSNFNGPIYLDVHSMARRVGENMKREFRTISDFSEWAENVDVIQANEEEFNCLTDKDNIPKYILDKGTKYLIKTMGNKGTRVYMKDGEEIKSIFISANKIEEGATVGCGDIFGSVFFYNYIKGENFNNIIFKSNKAGAFAASCDNVKEMKKFNDEY